MKKKTKNKQEASSRLAAGVAAAGNAAVRVALAAQEGEEGESRAGEERPGAGAQEEQPQKDEVKWIQTNNKLKCFLPRNRCSVTALPSSLPGPG